MGEDTEININAAISSALDSLFDNSEKGVITRAQIEDAESFTKTGQVSWGIVNLIDGENITGILSNGDFIENASLKIINIFYLKLLLFIGGITIPHRAF